MSKAIVVGTYGGREDWLAECLSSLNGYTRYRTLALTVPWELNVIRWVYDHTDIDEFLFLQDTVVVKDWEWIDKAFDHPGSVSLCYKPFYMYLGKYTRFDLLTTLIDHDWPEVYDKRTAVTHEGEWTSWYNFTSINVKYLWDDWTHTDPQMFVWHNGRLNMYYENDHIIKYKGTWSPEMIPE